MYSRDEENFNENRSFGQPFNGGAKKKFDTSSNGQQMSCLSNNNNPKMDFSIFHGQNSSLQRNPVQYTSRFKDRSCQQASTLVERNPGSSSKQNAHLEKQNFPPFQHPRCESVFPKPNTPKVFYGNPTPVVSNSSSKVDFQKQNSYRKSRDIDNNRSNYNASTSSNTVGLMEMPKPNKYSSKTQNNTPGNTLSKTEDMSRSASEFSSRVKKYGETHAEKMCIFTGTVERVIKWGKIFQNHFCYFEVIAAVVSIADGKVHFEKIMLLRDKKGPILQVTYYSNSTHINIEDFHLGQILRAVGRMIGPNIMSAITIRGATTEELETLPRMCCVSDHAVSTLCGNL